MKKTFLPILLMLLVSLSLQAAKKVSGYYIDHSGKKNEVTFLVKFNLFGTAPQIEILQNKITYLDNNKKIKLTPLDAKEIFFTYKGDAYRMISVKDLRETFSEGEPLLFLKIEVDGMIKLFTYYSSRYYPGSYNSTTGATTGGGSSTTERYILQKGTGEFIRPRMLFFKKDVLPLFDDCEEMNDKIKNVSRATIESVLREYNERCK